MTALAVAPDPLERARDERDLTFLNCWEEGWSLREIGRAHGLSYNDPLNVVHRVHKADPEALLRKPASHAND